MDNELKNICYLLEGYSDNKGWLVDSACRHDDGTWTLQVKPKPKKEVAAEQTGAKSGE